MNKIKLINFEKIYLEKIIFTLIIAGSIWTFYFFEESLLLKLLITALGSFSGLIVLSGQKNTDLFKKSELAIFLILFLGILFFYNLLYSINLPLAIVMFAIVILTTTLFYCLFHSTQSAILDKNTFTLFGVTHAIIILETFLCLYFWPIDPETKALLIVLIFYLFTNLVYLYINNVLRLNRAIGFFLISIFIIAIILINTWLKMPR